MKNNDYDDDPYVIEGTTATVLFYVATWFFVAGLWKTLEVLAFLTKFLPSLH
jgi:hypothetical protein